MCKQYTIFNKKTHFANFRKEILYEIIGDPGRTRHWTHSRQQALCLRLVTVGRILKVDAEPLLPFFFLVLVVVELVKLAGPVGNIRLQFPRIFQ